MSRRRPLRYSNGRLLNLFGSEDGMSFLGWGVLTKTPKIRCNIQNNFGGFWSLGKNTWVWKACETTLSYTLICFLQYSKDFFQMEKTKLIFNAVRGGVFRHSVQFSRASWGNLHNTNPQHSYFNLESRVTSYLSGSAFRMRTHSIVFTLTLNKLHNSPDSI